MLSRLRRRGRTPRLSVVVPVYNVEVYLAECLDSILAQEFADLEVVIVDDGSTDGSPAIASMYADRHRQISVVRTDNHGLGAARNHGARLARGELLAFVDSDDTLPSYAYALMVSALDESGSDLVVGSVQQRIGDELVEPAFVRAAHRRRRLRVTLDEVPEAMHNVFAWDKVFRRSFWDSAGLAFPEGVRYEDQATMIEAYLRARAFDVVVRPVYHWRIRADGSSITQQRHELADLHDRLVTKQRATDVVRRLGSAHVLDYWARHGLVGDLPVYFREIPGADEEYWRLLRRGMAGLFEGLAPVEASSLRAPMRLVGWLVTRGRRADAERVLAWVAEHPGPLPLTVEGDDVVVEMPFAREPESGVPAELCRLRPDELEFDARLQTVQVDAGRIVVQGLALVRGAPTSGTEVVIGAWLVSGDDTVSLEVQRRLAPEATVWINRPPQVYDDSGFVVVVDPAELVRGDGEAARSWALHLDVRVGGIARSGPVRSKDRDLIVPVAQPGGVRVTVDAEGLTLHVP